MFRGLFRHYRRPSDHALGFCADIRRVVRPFVRRPSGSSRRRRRRRRRRRSELGRPTKCVNAAAAVAAWTNGRIWTDDAEQMSQKIGGGEGKTKVRPCASVRPFGAEGKRGENRNRQKRSSERGNKDRFISGWMDGWLDGWMEGTSREGARKEKATGTNDHH